VLYVFCSPTLCSVFVPPLTTKRVGSDMEDVCQAVFRDLYKLK